jgi:hypothetical protein
MATSIRKKSLSPYACAWRKYNRRFIRQRLLAKMGNKSQAASTDCLDASRR